MRLGERPDQPSRRDVLKAVGVITGGLIVGFLVPRGRPQESGSTSAKMPEAEAFLRIGTDGTITVILAHCEMGQGVWTTLPMLIAEELDADWSTIRVQHAPVAAVYTHLQFGTQMTGNSSSTLSEFDRYRQVGAVTRAMLIQAAARRFRVPPADCRTDNGWVLYGTQRVRYADLAEEASAQRPPEAVKLKDSRQWRIIGKPTRRLDCFEKITGHAQYGIDVQLPGLLTAVVARAPVFGGAVKSFRADKARAVLGVREVVRVPSGVAVIGDNFWAVKKGRDLLEIDWDSGPSGKHDSTALRLELQRLVDTSGVPASVSGDVDAGLARANRLVKADYYVPYLAQAPMEPLNCTVRLSSEKCEIWTGTQYQMLDQQVAARASGLKPEQVELHTMFIGCGFGRRGCPDGHFVAEATHVAKAAGRPVKTVWTREDDIRGGYYRPTYLHRVQIALSPQGFPVAWHHRIAGQSILAGTIFEAEFVKDGVDPSSVEGVIESPYLEGIGNRRLELHSPQTGIPVLWWRSVGHSHTAFVMESLIDELATASGRDPVAYRRTLLKNHPRHLAVLNLAAERAGWARKPPKARALGVAVHASFGSYLALIAEVSATDGQIHVHRVVCAVDCGIAINPAGVEAQMESGIAFGLGAALHSEITFKAGSVEQSNFHDYQVLRLNEMPQIEVHIISSNESPGGVGEAAVPPIAPAVANAVAQLTGRRLRELPLRLPK